MSRRLKYTTENGDWCVYYVPDGATSDDLRDLLDLNDWTLGWE